MQPHSNHLIRHSRLGATLLECAITLPVLFIVVFALLDLGIAATRFNALSEASRRIAREAILHGSLATSAGMWGPNDYTGTFADTSEMVASGVGMLPTMDAGAVSVHITWPDNDNSPRDRVQVDVSYRHVPLIPVLFPWGPIDLHSSTTMHIVN